MNHLESWAAVNKMEINAKKTKDMWISLKKTSDTPPPLHINNVKLERVTQFKLLGVAVQNDLNWNSHITNLGRFARISFLGVSKSAGPWPENSRTSQRHLRIASAKKRWNDQEPAGTGAGKWQLQPVIPSAL